MKPDDLFTAPQVARLCSTDLKTIHNWVNRGEITCFRTPGRHLRFRRRDIQDFLVRFGYPVPVGFAPTRPRVVVINASEHAYAIDTNLASDAEIVHFPDHLDALLSIGRDKPALVLVNGDSGPDMFKVVRRISASESDLKVAVFAGGDALRQQSVDAGAIEFIDTTRPKLLRDMVVSLLGVAS